MARQRRKIHVHDFRPRKGRSMHVPVVATVSVRSGAHSARYVYEACVQIRRRKGSGSAAGTECATGRAPRRALGAALKRLGASMVRRSSAFRGT
jgi:hypothetical protein